MKTAAGHSHSPRGACGWMRDFPQGVDIPVYLCWHTGGALSPSDSAGVGKEGWGAVVQSMGQSVLPPSHSRVSGFGPSKLWPSLLHLQG